MVSCKVKFSEVPIGSICQVGAWRLKKTANVLTRGKRLNMCAPNCISLHNGHRCVISEESIVEVLEK